MKRWIDLKDFLRCFSGFDGSVLIFSISLRKFWILSDPWLFWIAELRWRWEFLDSNQLERFLEILAHDTEESWLKRINFSSGTNGVFSVMEGGISFFLERRKIQVAITGDTLHFCSNWIRSPFFITFTDLFGLIEDQFQDFRSNIETFLKLSFWLIPWESRGRRSHKISLLMENKVIEKPDIRKYFSHSPFRKSHGYKSMPSFLGFKHHSFHCSTSYKQSELPTLIYLRVSLFLISATMSQSSFLGKDSVEKRVGGSIPMRKIKIPKFDNSALIAGYAKTVIGRCMNPRLQDMKSLIFMLPRIWNLEGKVVGADLGLGRFQFDFDNEDDITEVLKMEPFHFDYWMVAMVRWKPTLDPSYPCMLTFWIRILGVPLQFWADPTFRGIGEDLGQVEEVDLDGGRVRVTIDGFKPLCFETQIEFGDGEETIVKLRYERLFGFCKHCFSLCHSSTHCPRITLAPTVGVPEMLEGEGSDRFNQSYKGAIMNDKMRNNDQEGKLKGSYKGRGKMEQAKPDGQRFPSGKRYGPRAEQFNGEPSYPQRRYHSYSQLNDHRGLRKEASEATKPPMTEDAGKAPKQIRKALFQGSSEAIVEPIFEEEAVVDALQMKQNLSQVIQKVGDMFGGQTLTEKETEDTEDRRTEGSVEVAVEEFSETAVEAYGSLDTAGEMESNEGVSEHMELDKNSGKISEVEVSSVIVDGKNFDPMATCKSLEKLLPEAPLISIKSKAMVGEKGKKAKGGLPLRGISSKKRNVQRLTTPRKRPLTKIEEPMGEGEDKKPKDLEKGPLGGAPPTNPSVDP